MPSKYFSILIVPDQTSQVRRITIPRVYLVAGLLTVLAAVCLLVAGVTHYTVLLADHAEYEKARQQYRAVASQLGTYQDRIDRVDERLRHMALMERKLRLMTRLEDPDRNIAIGPILEEGVPDTELGTEPGLTVGNELDEKSYEFRKLGYKLDRVEKESKTRELSLEELNALLEDQRDLLDSTPSVWPTRGFTSSTFGYRVSPFTGRRRMHQGLDIAAPQGTLVNAPADGIVSFTGVRGAYGKLVTVDHGYGVVTRYGHLSEILVKPGQRIKRGDSLAKVGRTGRSTGDHLHYEVRLDGVPVNPELYILE